MAARADGKLEAQRSYGNQVDKCSRGSFYMWRYYCSSWRFLLYMPMEVDLDDKVTLQRGGLAAGGLQRDVLSIGRSDALKVRLLEPGGRGVW